MKLNYKISPSNVFQKEWNTQYLSPVIVTSLKDFKKICEHDYTCGEFKNNTRSNDNFISTNCLVMDLDNDHSEDPKDWLTVDDIKNEFLNVPFLVHYSRNHLKEKNGKAPRPKFHVIFPCNEITSDKEIRALKEKIINYLPLFDGGAKDAARFIYGSKDAKVDYVDGTTLIDDFIRNDEASIEFLLNDEKPILEGSRNTEMHKIACKLLKRYGCSDTSITEYYKNAERCEPRLEESELKTIWNSASKFYENKISKQPGYISPDKYNNPTSIEDIEFDELMPLKPAKLMDFPLDTLPITIKNYVEAVSESIQAPIDMAAICALGALSSAMQKRYIVKVSDDHEEQINLYLVVVAAPSERKSPVLKKMTKVLREYEASYNTRNEMEIQGSIDRKKQLKATYETKFKNKDGKFTQEEIDKAREDYYKYKEKHFLSLMVDDTTPEALTYKLSEQEGSISIISSEGGFFDIIAGAYNDVTNIDVLLKAYSGDSIKVDRINRAEIKRIDNPSLTMLFTVQPNVIEKFLSNSVFEGKGLSARFLYSFPKSRVGTRVMFAKTVDKEIENKYNELINSILKEDYNSTTTIEFDNDSRALINDFFNEIENEIKTTYKEMQNWIGKIVGNTFRIAGLLARADKEFYDDLHKDEVIYFNELTINKDTMINAIKISRYFIDHAKYAFNQMVETSVLRLCQDVVEIIKKENYQNEVKVRDLKRKSAAFKRKVQPVLDTLETYGYILPKERDMNAVGRPAISYWVNPAIFKEDETND